MNMVTPPAFASLDTLRSAMHAGTVRVGDEVSVTGQVWDTSGSSTLGQVRLTTRNTYLTAKLTGQQGILDALEAVSKQQTGMDVTVSGIVRGIGWGSDEGIDVLSVRIPAA